MKRPVVRLLAATLLAACAAFICGCDLQHRTLMTDIRDASWTHPVSLTFSNSDTVSLVDLHLLLRYDPRLAPSRLGLDIRTESADSLFCTEHIEAWLPRGGRSLSPLRDADIVWRTRARLHICGQYRITLTPATEAAGIAAAGIEIVAAD